MPAREFNLDGIVGPTHNYAGLSYGNVASTSHQNQPSNPREAALQGLAKMRDLAALGIGQAVLPPIRRPAWDALRHLGYEGSPSEIIAQVAATEPALLAAAYSASSMWTANAATISPSPDCDDGRLHLTVANLASNLHRALEPAATLRLLQFVFSDQRHFAVHPPLPAAPSFADEGAANHTRLSAEFGTPGLECFVFGRDASAGASDTKQPARFPARQTAEASRAIARRHRLDPRRTIFLQQHPAAIDAGVFHNDVISVGHQQILLCHEQAFVDQPRVLSRLRDRFEEYCRDQLVVIEIAGRDLPLEKAVQSYLFNSQLVTRPDGGMTMICPTECREIPEAHRSLEGILALAGPIDQVQFVDLRQSMRNGGGPACLRLRVVLTEVEQAAMHQGILFSEALFEQLTSWVNSHYRDRLVPEDLRDPQLAVEVDAALDELAQILELPHDLL
jgi:succinylarginine dihydrolase